MHAPIVCCAEHTRPLRSQAKGTGWQLRGRQFAATSIFEHHGGPCGGSGRAAVLGLRSRPRPAERLATHGGSSARARAAAGCGGLAPRPLHGGGARAQRRAHSRGAWRRAHGAAWTASQRPRWQFFVHEESVEALARHVLLLAVLTDQDKNCQGVVCQRARRRSGWRGPRVVSSHSARGGVLGSVWERPAPRVHCAVRAGAGQGSSQARSGCRLVISSLELSRAGSCAPSWMRTASCRVRRPRPIR